MRWDKFLPQLSISFITVITCILFANITNAQQPSTLLRQGETLTINGETVSISWRKWQSNGKTHLGITDAAAQQQLGLQLLSNKQPHQQPVSWFSRDQDATYSLSAQHFGGYRYIDLMPILNQSTEELAIVGDRVEIQSTPSKIKNIRTGKHPWGKRIVIDLEDPIFWQMQQTRQQATVTLPATTPDEIVETFSSKPETETSPRFDIKSNPNQTELEINLPPSSQLATSTLTDPTRLVLDIRPDWIKSREIHWAEGIHWKQDYIPSAESGFAVSWLEIEPHANVNLTPIWHNPQKMEGIANLAEIGKENDVAMAINGGFFNRNTQQPLGAIKQNGKWYSSPILNRGAIAWDNQGNVTMERLRYQETLVTHHRETFSLQAVNSGYAQSGIARYTPEWGRRYTPIREQETIVVVKNQQVKRLIRDKEKAIPIPPNGYLLAIRNNPKAISALTVGTQLELQRETIPANFESYPHTLAAGPLLMKNGQVVLDAQREGFSQAFIQQKAYRSAIALTQKGTILLVTIGNNQQGEGVTLSQMPRILKRLGATDALNLDGGNSTSLYLGGELINRPTATAGRIHNGLGVKLNN